MKLPMGFYFLRPLIADILGVKYDHFYHQRDQSSKGKKRKKGWVGGADSARFLFLWLSGLVKFL